LCYTIPHNNHSTFLKASVIISYYSRCSNWYVHLFLFFSLFLIHTFVSEWDCTPLQCFYKGCTQSNKWLLMHTIHYGSTIFS
jgi:hypothetical protein